MDNTKLKSRMSGKVQELQNPTPAAEAAKPETSLVPAASSYIALTSNALDLIRDNLKHQPLSLDLFDIVKSPSGGSTVFSVPGLAGDEAEKELTGIILDYTTPRAYWDTPDPVEGTPPVCMSQDSVVSQNGESCAHCPYNDFGSKDGASNAKDSYYANGSLGTLKIPAIGLNVKIEQGTDSAALKKGVGHFEETSIWNGNVGLAAHNRGTNSYFGKIHTLEAGDEITLTTKEGTRTYEVTSVAKVTETDRSSLKNTSNNCLTLYTCVRDERDLRWCVRAVELTD